MIHTRAAVAIGMGGILGFMASAGLTAQRITGDITGTIVDDTQGVVPGSTITGVCSATGLTRATTSDGSGGYPCRIFPSVSTR